MPLLAVQEVVLGDLQPDTSYSVSVGAYTAKGDGARSTPLPVCSGLPRTWSPNTSMKTFKAKRPWWSLQDPWVWWWVCRSGTPRYACGGLSFWCHFSQIGQLQDSSSNHLVMVLHVRSLSL